jgi:hypothetical protein
MVENVFSDATCQQQEQQQQVLQQQQHLSLIHVSLHNAVEFPPIGMYLIIIYQERIICICNLNHYRSPNNEKK